MPHRFAAFLAGLALATLGVHSSRGDKTPAKTFQGLPLLFADDFESGNADRWEPSDPKAWRVTKVGATQVYNQFQQSKVKTPVRSPFNRALIKDLVLGDFILE